jgi:hypothetical protein
MEVASLLQEKPRYNLIALVTKMVTAANQTAAAFVDKTEILYGEIHTTKSAKLEIEHVFYYKCITGHVDSGPAFAPWKCPVCFAYLPHDLGSLLRIHTVQRGVEVVELVES